MQKNTRFRFMSDLMENEENVQQKKKNEKQKEELRFL